jgi:glycogen synthase
VGTASQNALVVILSELGGVTEYNGGVGFRYARLLPALAARGAAIHVHIIADSPTYSKNELGGCTVTTDERLCKLPPLLRPLPRALLARRFLQRHKNGARIALAPDWQGALAFAPRTVSIVTNLVTSLRLADAVVGNYSVAPGPRTALRHVQYLLEKRQTLRSSRLIPCSRAIRDAVRELYGELGHVEIVPNSIDLDRIRELSQASTPPAGFPSTGRTMLFVGRLEQRKGFVTAVEAFCSLAQDDETLHFVAMGGDPEQNWERVVAHSDRPPRDRMHHFELQSPGTVFASLAKSDVCVCPSLWEAFGNVALEAMAVGTPCVVTSGSGFDDFCVPEQNSLVVSPRDAGGLAMAIDRILHDSRLSDGLRQGGIRTAAQHRVQTVADRFMAALFQTSRAKTASS